ncbi:DUF190 domain-containing protein [Mycobacterium sp. 236(2023)]|uniref:DUF190 domain-containing protein n=1 Tax=Mycobacterium sp. 236(2023) TaxID=3038163 RepID=UPI0024152240|nr:DUF190 domain-containing protein [Mycobacterium sp. 236(2023)]MDG4664563.1 DUF190 domain-containing protein [Mycobacterium sp. 236(2023)]
MGMSDILTLKVYFAERERSGDRFLADAMLDLFEKRAIATSIMLRGIASFGPTNILRSDRSLSLSEDPPVTISAIDTSDKITALADDVAALTRRGVITVEREGEPSGIPHDTVRMTLHLGRRHRISGEPAYVTVCAVLHRHGFAGADVYLGVDGTVAGLRHRAKFFSRNNDVPLSIVGVGTGAQADAAVDELRGLLPDAWFTIEPTLLCRNGGQRLASPALQDSGFYALAVSTSESSLHDGRPIHRQLIRRLKESPHASGATVLRGIWGFRGAERPHGDRFLQLARHVPVTTVLLDTAENIAASYPIVDDLTEHEGLVTIGVLARMFEVHGEGHPNKV